MVFSYIGTVFGITVLQLLSQSSVHAGMCLELQQPNGNCIGLYYPNKTAAECCNHYGNFYIIENYSFEERFRIRISGSGFPNCMSCAVWKQRLTQTSSSSTIEDKCKDVNCGPNKVCRLRHNTLTCVCQRPKCKKLPPNPVCSNFNKTYRTECSLNRHACINNKQEQVAYDGPCRDSCKGIRCRDGMQCIEFKDKTKMPYCVKCNGRLCTQSSTNSPVCGANNVTYSSYCKLRMATCRRGKTIGIAYTGPCKGKANCSNVVCPKDMICLKDNNGPRCVRCSRDCTDIGDDLSRKPAHLLRGQVCGTDRQTYPNLCAMRKNSCKTRKFIGVLHHGVCKPGNCSSIVCKVGETCLMDKTKPRCAVCSMAHCMTTVKLALKRDPQHYYGKQMCGTDDNTYPNLCALRKQACKSGKYINVQHIGACQGSSGAIFNKTEGPNDQSYKPMTNQYIESLKNKTVSMQQLMSVLQTFGLKVHLDNSSKQQTKTVDAYPFFCHMLRSFTKANIWCS